MKKTTLFRRYLADPKILMLPVCHDPLGARILERAGFEAVACAGYATAAARLGAPDIGLLTLTEMADALWRIADAVDLPVFADGDNGHGNAANVIRTVKLLERAGAATIMLEDQVSPKRCGHMPGKELVDREAFRAKIRAALDARTDPDLAILARTDANAVAGFEEALERAALWLEEGADWVFVEGPASEAELAAIPQRVPGLHLANMIPGGLTPDVPADRLEAMGYACVAYPTVLTYAYARAAMSAAETLRTNRSLAGLEAQMVDFATFNALVGLPEIRAREKRLFEGE